jgi:SAM-dependent methyltransferase
LGVDISRVALVAAQRAAVHHGVWRHVLFVQADLDYWRPPRESFDLVVVFRFLDRRLYPALKESVRPGGLVVYGTRHRGILDRIPDANPAYLLERGELRAEFSRWRILLDAEGAENAALIARKPRLHTG